MLDKEIDIRRWRRCRH